MKHIKYNSLMNERQIAELAKDLLIKNFNEIPAVSSVEVLPNKKDKQMFDIVLEINFNTLDSVKIIGEVNNIGEIKFIRQSIAYLKNVLQKNEYGIVVVPYISQSAAQLCEENMIGYLDFSGNCLLKHSNFYLRIEGKSNKYVIKKENKNILIRSSVKSGIVLREMLNKPEKFWNVQELANTTMISLGMISNIKRFLLSKEWCVEENGKFALNNIAQMLIEWSLQYNKTKNISYEFYSFDGVAEIEKKMFLLNEKNNIKCVLASFSAGARYKPTVIYNKVVAYVEQQDFDEVIEILNLKPVESGGNVELLLPHDNSVLMYCMNTKDSFITSPAQTILDLYSNKARGEEAAEAIIEKEYRKNDR